MRLHSHPPGQFERFREVTFGRVERAAEVLGETEVEGLVNDAVAVAQRTGDVERLDQVGTTGVQVTHRQLGVPEVAKHRSRLQPVTNLAEQLQRLSSIAGRRQMVTLDI